MKQKIVLIASLLVILAAAGVFASSLIQRNRENVDKTAAVPAAPVPEVKIPSVTILIGGDIMFDRGIRLTAEKNGYDNYFASMTPLFADADIVMANLEGPITSNPSRTMLPNGHLITNDLTFTFDLDTAAVLSRIGITLVSLANNHTANFGHEGLTETRHALDAAGVGWFGDPWNASSTEMVIDKNGIKVAFVGYHEFEPGVSRILADVRRLSNEGDFVIVMPHWGQEYAPEPSQFIKDLAHQFIQAGASAVIGSHPHVVQPHEFVGNVPVFYSLGNLLFDQYFSTSTMTGELVKLKISAPTGLAALESVTTYKTSFVSRKTITYEPESDTIEK